jgi:two-component system LytT family response regulator
VASSPWRGQGKASDGRVVSPREPGDEAVLDLTQEDGGLSTSAARPLRVLVREGRRTRFVPLADVDWFEADGNYIRVHTAGERFRTRGTITAIEAALDAPRDLNAAFIAAQQARRAVDRIIGYKVRQYGVEAKKYAG